MTEAAVTFECDLDAPPEKVWRALVEPDLRADWLGDAGEVIESRPGEQLTLRWTLDEPPSLITFEIREADGGAHLTITHESAQSIVIPFKPAPDRAVMRAGPWRMAA